MENFFIKNARKCCFLLFQTVHLPPAAFLHPQNVHKSLGELTALPRPLAGLRGPTSKGREKRRGRGEKDS